MATAYVYGFTLNARDDLLLTMKVFGGADSLHDAKERIEVTMEEDLDESDEGGPGEYVVEELHLPSGRPGPRWFKRSHSSPWEKWDPAKDG